MVEQTYLFESGNELAAWAAKQIDYHVMGYYPITPSTQIAEELDLLGSQGAHRIRMLAAEGEHSAAGICYGAAAGGARVLNATSANGLLYALEQLPVQSGTRMPMVLNVACRTVSGPLCIKGDHSDIMYALNAGWIILFAQDPQQVYDFNLCALRIAEAVNLPVIVAYDGFFTSHQKRRCAVMARDEDARAFVGPHKPALSALDPERPVTIGSYMNEPDVINNRYQLHLAMEQARPVIERVFAEYGELTGRTHHGCAGYRAEDAEAVLFLLGSSYATAQEAVDRLREQGKRVGVMTLNCLRPFPGEALAKLCPQAKVILVGDRQDSYGAGGGNMSLEVRAMLQRQGRACRVLSRVYGLGGRDFEVADAERMLMDCFDPKAADFDYLGQYPGREDLEPTAYFDPVADAQIPQDLEGSLIQRTTALPKRLAPGHGACPGCGIPVNVNLLLRGITGPVVLLFQTGCGMVVTTPYPKTTFKVNYVHNLFQNGAATLAGLAAAYQERRARGELPDEPITFIMVSGDGGMDIGMGSALATAIRGDHLILFEYDNGGYMNTGYQLSYATPMGARSATSHIGPNQAGKGFFHKDMAQIMAATGMPYVATVAESHPADFIQKAQRAQQVAQDQGMAYLKCLSACPLNWGDKPNTERKVIAAAVESCYFPLYEVVDGVTRLSYDPGDKRIPVAQFLGQMGRTKHLTQPEYAPIAERIQQEVDRRYERLKARAEHPLL